MRQEVCAAQRKGSLGLCCTSAMTWQVPEAPKSMPWAVPCGCGRLNGWCAGWPGGSWSAAARWKGLAWTAAQ